MAALDDTITSPVAVELEPDEMDTTPLLPTSADPLVRVSEPLEPAVDRPDTIVTDPLTALELPVLSVSEPLDAVPDSPELTASTPLLPDVAYPDPTVMAPELPV